MRRTLLLRWAACFVACAFGGSLSLLAQTDVTNTYLVNPSFEGENVASLPVVGTKGEGDSYRGWTLAQPTGWTVTNSLTGQLKEAEAYTDNGFGTVGAMADGTYCYYQRQGWSDGTTKIAQTITSTLPAGVYSFKVKVKTAYANSATSLVTLSANGTNSSATTFTKGTANQFNNQSWTELSVQFTLDEPKANVEVALNISWVSGGSQIAIDDVRLTVEPFATTDDYDALEAAINSSELKALGFEEGEYAPYINVDAIKALSLAKAINRATNNSQLHVQELTSTLTTGWTANDGEVNAIYDGSFDAASSNVATNTVPTGWHGSDDNYNNAVMTRYVYSNGSGNNGLYNHFANHSAMMSKSYPTYGKDEGYTLPLKANTWYKLTFDFGGWGPCTRTTTIVVKDANGAAVAVSPAESAAATDGAQDDENKWKTYTGYFKTDAKGNYTLQLRKDSEQNNGEWQIAYGDIVLKKAETTTANMKVAAGKWGTFIAPFDVAIPADVEAYKVTGIVNDTYMDKEEVTTTIPANTPVVLKNVGEDDVDTDLLIPNTATEVAYTEGLLTGVYTAATIAASDASNTRYVLQTQDEVQAFYKVDAAFTAKPNRAYLTVPAAASAKKMLYFDFDDAATAIAGIEPTETEDDAPAYNVAGQRVQNGYKGIVIKNGVKYLNK